MMANWEDAAALLMAKYRVVVKDPLSKKLIEDLYYSELSSGINFRHIIVPSL